MNALSLLFANRIVIGKYEYKDVPEVLKEQVADILKEHNREDLIIE